MEKKIDVSFSDFIRYSSPREVYNNELIVFDISNSDISDSPGEIPPIRINAFSVFIALQGEIAITIDYVTYHLKKGMIFQMNSLQVMEYLSISPDFKGYFMLMTRDFLQVITGKIQSLKKLVLDSRRLQPALQFEDDEIQLIVEIIERLRKNMKADKHAFQRQLIENEVSNFVLELTNFILQRIEEDPNFEEGHREEIANKFIKLLIFHCKEQHNVSFYAGKLNMTPEHLSRIMKSISGKTVNIWINDALIAESKILLRNMDMNVQQISEELNFADQSSFGKFFKKQVGKTPIEYRISIL